MLCKAVFSGVWGDFTKTRKLERKLFHPLTDSCLLTGQSLHGCSQILLNPTETAVSQKSPQAKTHTL